jgi:hypothetical protein
MLPRCKPAGMPSAPPEPGDPTGGGLPAETLSPRVMVLVKGDMCGIASAVGCSVPIEVTPVSEALPALERA